MSKLPEKMKAARVLEPAEKLVYHIQELPLPTIRPTELLLKVGAAGFCHTDFALPKGFFGNKLPTTGSHEPAGTIVEVGADTSRFGKFKVGDRVVAVNTARTCGDCPECKYHDARYCMKQHMIGLVHTDGAFADYCIVDASRSVVIPDNMSFGQAAPLSCAGVTVLSAIKRAGLKPGEVIGLIGLGGLGTLGLQFAKAMGLKVVGVDARDGPIALANSLNLKPDLTINALNQPVEEAAKMVESIRGEGWDRGPGCDAVCLLHMEESGMGYARGMVKNHGKLVLVGMPREPKFDAFDFIFRQITVFGTQNGSQEDLQDAVELCRKYGIESEVHEYKLEEESINKLVADVQTPGWTGKAVVVM